MDSPGGRAIEEILDLRIPEQKAQRFLDASTGKTIGGGRVRQVIVRVGDPLWETIATIQRELLAQDDQLYLGWGLSRRYSADELAAAELFHFFFTRVFEPPGEMCGTLYDDSTACPACGAGRTQLSDLVLDLRKAPKTDFATTIADEYIIAQRAAEILVDANVGGIELRPVRHRSRYDEDPVELEAVPSGRELQRLAADAGVDPSSWEFYVWLNRPEQAELSEQAWTEYRAIHRIRDSTAKNPPPTRHQLKFTRSVPVSPPTRFGSDLVDDDPEGEYRCPFGHVAGLGILSEVFVPRKAAADIDFAITEQLVGKRGGVLVPERLMLISPRVRGLLIANELTGWDAEVAYLV